MIPDISGPGYSEAFAYFDHDSSCWRMSQGTLFSDSTPSSVTLPKSGWMRRGCLFGRPTSAPLTDVSGCSSLLPTPTTSDAKGPSPNHSGTTSEAIRDLMLLPTPTAYQPGGTPEQFLARKEKAGAYGRLSDLRMAVEALLPTPSAGDSKGSRSTTLQRQPDSTAKYGDTLTDAAWKLCLLPAPTARLGTARGAQADRYKNPERSNDLDDAVLWLTQQTGDSSPLPFDGGNT